MIPLSKLLQQKGALILSVLLAAAVFAAFLPVLHNGFINYDDPVYVYSNPHVTGGLTWPNIQWAFHTLDRGFWHPLTWLSSMFDCELFGLEAGGHHLTSLLLHTASTVLLFLALRRMTGSQWRSALVAALFGLHPLHVESVVWASERKDVLSAFFFMLTLLAYAEYVAQSQRVQSLKSQVSSLPDGSAESPPSNLHSALRTPHSALWYVLSLVFFTLGLMSKAMLVTVPVVLLLLDFWPLGRWELRRKNAEGRSQNQPTPNAGSSNFNLRHSSFIILLEKLPFFALALLFALLTVLAQREMGAVQTVTRFPLLFRVDNALLSAVHYLRQTVWPAGLAVFYSYPRSFPLWQVALAALVLVLLTALAWWQWRRRPYLAFGWMWYVLMLLPVIGIIQVGSQSRADRYTYLPLIGIFVMLAWALGEKSQVSGLKSQVSSLESQVSGLKSQVSSLESQVSSPEKESAQASGPSSILHLPSSILCLMLLLACAYLTHRQVGFWRDSETVFRHALAVTRDNEIAHNNLGTALNRKGRLDEAIVHLREAVRLAPAYAVAQGNLGSALFSKGLLDESIAHSREAIRLKPNFAGAYRNLGAALGAKGRVDEAIACFQQALKYEPGDPQTCYNLGYAFLTKGRYDEAIAQFQQVLQLKPDYAPARQNLELALQAKARSARK